MEEQMKSEERWVHNYYHDFNRPWMADFADEQPEVGDIVRMVDMDPTAGYCLARITEVEPATEGRPWLGESYSNRWHFSAQPMMDTFVRWDPMEILT